MVDLIKPQEITVTDADKVERKYIVSRMPATVAREVLAKYIGGAAPKIGDYESNHGAMLTMMQFVAVEIDGACIPLKTEALINNHIPDAEALIKVEVEMIRHNTSFFGVAGSQTLGGFLQSKALDLYPKIMKMLTPFLEQLSQQNLQR